MSKPIKSSKKNKWNCNVCRTKRSKKFPLMVQPVHTIVNHQPIYYLFINFFPSWIPLHLFRFTRTSLTQQTKTLMSLFFPYPTPPLFYFSFAGNVAKPNTNTLWFQQSQTSTNHYHAVNETRRNASAAVDCWSPSENFLKVMIITAATAVVKKPRVVLCDEECLRGIAGVSQKLTLFQCFECETVVFVTSGN